MKITIESKIASVPALRIWVEKRFVYPKFLDEDLTVQEILEGRF